MNACRCPLCFGWVSTYCSLCAGSPDPLTSLEQIARGVHQVDVATSGTAIVEPFEQRWDRLR